MASRQAVGRRYRSARPTQARLRHGHPDTAVHLDPLSAHDPDPDEPDPYDLDDELPPVPYGERVRQYRAAVANYRAAGVTRAVR
jgi:hypothetical protein